MNKENIKTLVQGAIAGAVVLAIGGFSSGVVVTSRTADTMARDRVEVAVIEHLAPICVAQFSRDENRLQLRTDLEAKDSWKRAGFVKTSGWATMPGSDAPRDDIARACAELIMKLSV